MRFVALFLPIFLGACHTAPPDLIETEIAQIEADVLASVETAFEGRRQKDVEMAMLPFHPTATAFVWGSVPRDYSDVRELTADRFEELGSWEGSFIDYQEKGYAVVFVGTEVIDGVLSPYLNEARGTSPEGLEIHHLNMVVSLEVNLSVGDPLFIPPAREQGTDPR